MVNPVSSDKVLSQNSTRSNGADERRAERLQQDNKPNTAIGSPPAGSDPADDNLQLSRAGELFSQAAEQTGRSRSPVQSGDQARALIDSIRQQFQSSPEQALKAQAGSQIGQYATLLQTTPA